MRIIDMRINLNMNVFCKMVALKFFNSLFIPFLFRIEMFDVVRLLIHFLLLSVSFDFVCCPGFCQCTTDCKELRCGEKLCI